MQVELLTMSEAVESFNPYVAVGLLVAYSFVEMLDSSLTFTLTQHKAMKSAVITFILYIVLGIEVLAFVTNYLYAIPIALGAAIGAYLVVENEKKKRPLK